MDSFNTGVRFRAYPTAEQSAVLRQWIGCQRVIYNAKVSEDKYFSVFRRKSLSLTGAPSPLDQQYAQFKNDELTPWLSAVPSQVLRNGAVRWRTAKQRQLSGLARAPAHRRAHGRQSVLLTKELFQFLPRDPSDPTLGHRLMLGTPKFPVGELAFYAHRTYAVPAQLSLSVEAGRWYVGFSFEAPSAQILRSATELAYEANLLTDAALKAQTVGYDRGVANRLVASDGTVYAEDASVSEQLVRKAVHAKRYQRRMARQQPGSNNRKKTRQKLARLHAYRGRCAQDWAHKATHQMVQSGVKVHVLEALQVKNLTRKASPKQVDGKWVKNGARAKSGLNKVILESCWGRVAQYLGYKAARANQLVLSVAPAYSSQECSECHYTHPDNRPTQAEFVCQRCGHAQHADANASCVIQQRGIAALRAGIKEKSTKRAAIRRKPNETGAERSRVSVEEPNKTPRVNRPGAHALMNQKIVSCEAGSAVL